MNQINEYDRCKDRIEKKSKIFKMIEDNNLLDEIRDLTDNFLKVRMSEILNYMVDNNLNSKEELIHSIKVLTNHPEIEQSLILNGFLQIQDKYIKKVQSLLIAKHRETVSIQNGISIRFSIPEFSYYDNYNTEQQIREAFDTDEIERFINGFGYTCFDINVSSKNKSELDIQLTCWGKK